MTYGELASMWNEEGNFQNGVKARLTVMPMTGWRRAMWYDETTLPWTAPSPNISSIDTAAIYPGLCLVEGTTLSEGRGTASPFELIGAPWLNPEKVISAIDQYFCAGIRFSRQDFIPRAIPGKAVEPKFEGEQCRGIRIQIEDRNAVEPVRLGIALLSTVTTVHRDQMSFDPLRFDRLSGVKNIRTLLVSGADPEEITALWGDDIRHFGDVRSRYLQYE